MHAPPDSTSPDAGASEGAAGPSLLGCLFRGFVFAAVLSVAIAIFPGMFVHMFVLPAIGSSPAGMFCPEICHDCSAPARTFGYNYSGGWHSKNGKMGYAFVCRNPVVDIDQLNWMDVSDDPLNTKLQPFMISSLTSWAIEIAMFASVVTVLGGPFLGIWLWQRARHAQRARRGES